MTDYPRKKENRGPRVPASRQKRQPNTVGHFQTWLLFLRQAAGGYWVPPEFCF